MNSHLITYDLNKPGQNYSELYEAIKNLSSNWWHCMDSNWIIKSNYTSTQIRDNLKGFLDTNDSLLVVKLNGEGAWTGLNSDCSNWLKNNL